MTKAEQSRFTAWRLRVLQQAADHGNVARVCRRFGISRKSFYKWKRRRAEHGDAGLCDRARTPRRSPRATAREVVSKILYLRQHYHFGAGRIAAYLSRFHQIPIAVSSVHRILTRHGMPRLPANQKHRPHAQRWQRYEKPQPGHRLQLDVKFLERIPGDASPALSVHGHRRLHPDSDPEDLRRVQSAHRQAFHRRSRTPAAISRARRPDRQRCRVPIGVPLASSGSTSDTSTYARAHRV
jgi:transposase